MRRRRMARSLPTRSPLSTKTVTSSPAGSSLTRTLSRTFTHGFPARSASSFVSLPFGVPTTYRPPRARGSPSGSSVGMPRSISHTRRALPWRASTLSRNARSVEQSAVLPAITS